ncbi:MAG: D-sedoheptulose 7-phosphate isomerase [Gaiellales bacterium]|nr:D-sedoheptulose 7-phosphate isomerase [Gaiellales bacterium]
MADLVAAGRRAGATARVTQTAARGALDELLARRVSAAEQFFPAEAGRIAQRCRQLAEQFARGGRLLAVASTPQGWSDARHVAVEFVHPVIVGKRALPALAVAPDDLASLRGSDDVVIEFDRPCLTIGEHEFDPPSDDPFVRQELGETLYHVLWELVHVFFDHLGGSTAGAGASSFLYPFLGEQSADLDAVEEDVRRSVVMKAEEASELRARTLEESADELLAAAATVRDGGTVLAFGNGGSATDAMDAVADFQAAPQGWPRRAALDLTADSAILTALANDIGPAVLFQRQIIAYGRRQDVALAFSTSGNSVNIIEALGEARRRGMGTVAMVGYDGGRVLSEGLADHVIVTRSEHIPRIQEAQASAYHVLRELVEAD